jgi:hypothetical protein
VSTRTDGDLGTTNEGALGRPRESGNNRKPFSEPEWAVSGEGEPASPVE